MNWTSQFPGLRQLDDALQQALRTQSRQLALQEGARVFGPGQRPEHYLLLLAGTVKVQQFSEGGRAIVLYRIAPGESCILTTAGLIGGEEYPAEAIAECAVQAVAIPRGLFDTLIAQSAPFRQFVFADFSQRITGLIRLIDEISFSRMDVRLAQKLLELAGAAQELTMTQQQLATELGSAREVVSRVLAELHRRGWLTVERGRVVFINRAALEDFASPGGQA